MIGFEDARKHATPVLEPLVSRSDEIGALARDATGLGEKLETSEDAWSWLSCVCALQAVALGNFGVGSVLVDPFGAIDEVGHNEVFQPRFRSDGHAEMVVMNCFEAKNPESQELGSYKLYTSLESCPMCLARLITSGVGEVVHVFDDETGGMVHKREDLPSVWVEIMNQRTFRKATCSQAIQDLSGRIFFSNVHELNEALMRRSEQLG